MQYEGYKVGENIKKLREKDNMNIGDLSDLVGKSESHIIQIERGARKMSIDLLYEMMDVLDADANTILGTCNSTCAELFYEINMLPSDIKEDVCKDLLHVIKRLVIRQEVVSV